MNKNARLIAISAALTLSFGTSAAWAAKIGVSMSQFDDNLLTVLRGGMQKHAASLGGVELQFEDAQKDVGRQLNQMQNFISAKLDAIIVNPVDTDATSKMTKLAAQAGIPLVYVNRVPADWKTLPPKVAFVGSNEVDSGTLEMQEVCRLMNGKGNIVVMIGDLANQAARQRTQDVEDVIAKPPCDGIKILDKRVGNWSRTEGADLVTNWISAGLKFDAIVSNNDEMAIGAVQSLKTAKLLDKVIVAGVDATTDALASMQAGELEVTVFQNAAAQGQGAVDTALKIAKGEKVPSMVWIPFELVTPANIKNYLQKN